MKQMFFTATVFQIIGFVLLLAMFVSAQRPHDQDTKLWMVFSFMGAIPLAGIGALFAGFRLLRDELRETRRELKHWQSIQSYVEPRSPSTGIKPAPPSGQL